MSSFKIAKTVLKSMFNKPATLMYPIVEREWQERTRGSIDNEVSLCILCGICARRCPTGAIDVDRKGATWEIKRMQCIQCGACVEACPKNCLIMNNKYTEPGDEKVIDLFEVTDVKKSDASTIAVDTDGELACDKEQCVFCGLCVKACPCQAITVDRKEKKWELNKDECVKCGECVSKCPKKCLGFGELTTDSSEKQEELGGLQDEEKLVCDKEVCVYCGICVKTCPCSAITVDRKEKSWQVDDEECVKCGECVEKCPKKCLSIKSEISDEGEIAEKDESIDENAIASETEKHLDAEVTEEDSGDEESEQGISDESEKSEEQKEDEAKDETEVDSEDDSEVEDETLSEETDTKKVEISTEDCIYCGQCGEMCPAEAIKVEDNKWELDDNACVGCGVCVEQCPTSALKLDK